MATECTTTEIAMKMFKHRLAFGIFLGLAYIYAVVSSLTATSGLGSGFTPDTASYLELAPYRQPMYGIWANTLYSLTASWPGVLYIQLALFALSVVWVLIELSLISKQGLLAAVFLALTQLLLLKMGMLGMVESLATEGIFYSMIMMSGALLMLWLRTNAKAAIISLAILIVAMTQLRTAALLVVLVPAVASIVAVLIYGRNQREGQLALAILTVMSVTALVGPILLGKAPFQLGTLHSTLGFALLPRVSLLLPNEQLAKSSPDWARMSASWRNAAATLDLIEVGQFDAQLQEAIRYELGPRVLLPAALGITQENARIRWVNGDLYEPAKDFALGWIREQWPMYLRVSIAHFWGTLTMGNYMGEESRNRVWAAVQALDPLTWELAPLRIDYPLNHIYEPLSVLAKLVYFSFRYASICTLILAFACAVQIVGEIRRRSKLSKGSLVLVLVTGWVIFHSIPIALTVFPEIRYTYANFLALSVGGLGWLAYLRPVNVTNTPISLTRPA